MKVKENEVRKRLEEVCGERGVELKYIDYEYSRRILFFKDCGLVYMFKNCTNNNIATFLYSEFDE